MEVGVKVMNYSKMKEFSIKYKKLNTLILSLIFMISASAYFMVIFSSYCSKLSGQSLLEYGLVLYAFYIIGFYFNIITEGTLIAKLVKIYLWHLAVVSLGLALGALIQYGETSYYWAYQVQNIMIYIFAVPGLITTMSFIASRIHDNDQ